MGRRGGGAARRREPYAIGAAAEPIPEIEEYVPLTDPKHFSRLLYANPVSILTTADDGRRRHNAMVVSWLTPINNHGVFLMSINKQRFSATLLLQRRSFCLSAAIHGMESVLLAIGRCHGHSIDKFATLGLAKVPFAAGIADESAGAGAGVAANAFSALKSSSGSGGSGSDGNGGEGADEGGEGALPPLPDVGVGGAAALMLCEVLSVADSVECGPGDAEAADSCHHIVTARVTSARVSRAHWNGRQFCAARGGASFLESRPALSFLGSQTFAYVCAGPGGGGEGPAAPAAEEGAEQIRLDS